MYRFLLKPKWIAFTLLCALAAAGMYYLGWGWQLDRYHEKRALKAELTAALARPAEAYSADIDDYVAVRLEGEFDDGASIRLAAPNGYMVYTPLRVTGAGDTYLVRRGFSPATESLMPLSPGRAQLVGRLRPVTDSERVVLPDIVDANQTRVLDVVTIEPAETAVTPPPPPRTPDTSNNISYLVQWTIFATCVLVGWVLAVHRTATVDHRRRKKQLNARTAERDARRAARKRRNQAVPWQK